jgi:subtilisin family serine protease
MFKSLALGALLQATDGARIQRKRDASGVKLVSGVPIHNYHLAFQADRWEASYVQAMAKEMKKDQEDWFVMMKKGTSNAELERLCTEHAGCESHGHSEGVPFLDLRATEAELAAFLSQEKDGVKFVEPNQPFEATPEMPASQSAEVPWGLRRVRSRELSNMPRSDLGAADGGKGVHAYILDTGIRTTHQDFEDRAIPTLETRWGGFSVRECNGDRTCALDKQGHGTHCAGTVGGKQFGVAKAVTLHAVKVLGDNGSGSTFGITNSMDWVGRKAIRPAVASMSLGGGFSQALNDALDSIVEAGIVVVTASGNENTDACRKSPGSAPLSINVGATNPADERAVFSNYGNCINIWAPGRDVLSAVATGDTDSKKYSGTSMACPHVSGAAALLLSASPSLTPEQVLSAVVAAATPDVVKDAKTGSPNLLMYSSP